MSSAQFPIRRMRRLRRTGALRRLVQETHLVPSQLVWPLFVRHGEGLRTPVTAMPGVAQLSVDQLVKEAERAAALELGGIILFGIPATKDATGSEAHDEQGIVQQAIRAVKRAAPVDSRMCPSCPMRRSSRRRSTDRFARPPARRRSSAIASRISWPWGM